MKTTLLLGAVLLGALAGCKKDKTPRINTQITGTVKYQDGTPAMGATVGVDGLAVQAVTNREGKYTLTGIPPGTQIVVALKPGYRPALKRDVEVPTAGRVTGVDLVLEPDPNYVPDQIKIE
ncbi:MAG: carboxypeptidase-like regulatory domain-containing protein, partial [Abditibacteriales bacterium]|nr:carboxypeptidase-like regulatory domain-containing protein [Abditibacteriales bacterium]